MSKETFNPLKPEEYVQMDELLAEIPDAFGPMDAAEADGFMTAVQLLPSIPQTRDWLKWILSTNGEESTTGAQEKDKLLRSLLIRRFNEIGQTLKESRLIDPVYFDVEDENGERITGKDSLISLQPFALGFLEAGQIWSGLLDTDSSNVALALHGILRHLPEESLGDFAATKAELDKEAPLEDLPAALSDLASCVAEIAWEIKGYPIPELCEGLEEDTKH